MRTDPAVAPSDLIAFAISRGICVLAVYNRSQVVLAPQRLLERRGEPFLKAVTLETDDRTPKVPKLGTFKLAGFSDLRLSGRTFFRETLFDEVEAIRQRITRSAERRRRQA